MQRRHTLKIARTSLFLLLLLSCCQAFTMMNPECASAQDAEKEALPNRFMVRGGANFIWNAETNMRLSGQRGIGATINYGDTLRGEQTDTVPRVDAYFRFNPQHSIGFTWYRVGRDGLNAIDKSIDFGNVTFPIGASVQSTLDIALYQFYYNYSFYHNEKVELALSAGFYLTEISASLTSLTTVGSLINTGTKSATDLLAPLPQIGFLMRYYITPRLNAELRANIFYLSAGGWQGSLADLYIGFEYRLFKNFGLGAALNRLNVNVEGPVKESATFKVDNSWNTAFVYGSIYF
ncbi:MAG: hypothetical protein ABW047_15550 [Nitrospiraceae bacterium]